MSSIQKKLDCISQEILEIEKIRCGCKINGVDCMGRLEKVGKGPLKYLKCPKCGHEFDATDYVRMGDVLIHKDDIKRG